MICPQCGSSQNDDLRFCKSCGANLQALRQILASREQNEKFNWNKTWLADMLAGGEDAVRRAAEIERLQGKTPEVKRRNEIKAGVITASVGVGLMIFLFALMGGIIASGRVSDAAAEILSRIWLAGVIPFMVGVALIVNGIFVSKTSPQQEEAGTDRGPGELAGTRSETYLPPADTNELIPERFSVTDQTTKHLKQRR